MKAQLLTPLKQVVIVPYVLKGEWDGVNWLTLTKIRFAIDDKEYAIPVGFVTDMGSVPRIARMTVDRMGKSLVAFVIHDYLYASDSTVAVERKVADEVLYQIGRFCGESWYTANKIYYAVRMFGWMANGEPNHFAGVSAITVLKIVEDNLPEIQGLFCYDDEYLNQDFSVFSDLVYKYLEDIR